VGKADNQILGIVMALKELHPERSVILVSKDINMRIKARALGLDAEDYFNDKVLQDSDLLYTGTREIDETFWERNGKDMKSWQEQGRSFYQVKGQDVPNLLINQMLWQEGPQPCRRAWSRLKARGRHPDPERLQPPQEQCVGHYRPQPRAELRAEPADGPGSGLHHPAGSGRYRQDPAHPGRRPGHDAGAKTVFGNHHDPRHRAGRRGHRLSAGHRRGKNGPWMGALEDNLDVLNKSDDDGGDWGRAATRDLVRSRIKVKSLNFMRGRTFLNKYLIIDEAQNLTPKQMKTLITRAGPGTKVVCLGNISQIDTPYLTEGSSGLTYVVDRFKGWEHSGHITLQRGERSRLADHAGEVL
jgi:PhoH-like ATPase